MRVALCLSGKLRNYLHTIPRLKQYLIDPLGADVFFYGCANHEGIDKNIKDIETYLQPISYHLYNYNQEVLQTLRNGHNIEQYLSRAAPTTCPDKMFGQYFNLYEVSKLKQRHEEIHNIKYDIVIRSRCDVFYHRTPTLEELEQAKNGAVLIPGKWSFDWIFPHAATDAFALCNSANFDKYASLYNYIKFYFKQGCLFHHESMMGHHLRHHKLQYIKCLEHFEWEYPAELSHIEDQSRHNYEPKNINPC